MSYYGRIKIKNLFPTNSAPRTVQQNLRNIFWKKAEIFAARFSTSSTVSNWREKKNENWRLWLMKKVWRIEEFPQGTQHSARTEKIPFGLMNDRCPRARDSSCLRLLFTACFSWFIRPDWSQFLIFTSNFFLSLLLQVGPYRWRLRWDFNCKFCIFQLCSIPSLPIVLNSFRPHIKGRIFSNFLIKMIFNATRSLFSIS